MSDLGPGDAATGPIEVGGTVYVSHAYSVVVAIDVRTGKTLWTFNPKAPEASGARFRKGWGSRGLAYWNGKILIGTHDGRLMALDAKTGTVAWRTQTLDRGDFRYIIGAPRVFAGKVIIGHSGADGGNTRGYVGAYDAETGKFLWRFYIVPGNPGRQDRKPCHADGGEDVGRAMVEIRRRQNGRECQDFRV